MPTMLPIESGRDARRLPDDKSWTYSSLYKWQTHTIIIVYTTSSTNGRTFTPLLYKHGLILHRHLVQATHEPINRNRSIKDRALMRRLQLRFDFHIIHDTATGTFHLKLKWTPRSSMPWEVNYNWCLPAFSAQTCNIMPYEIT